MMPRAAALMLALCIVVTLDGCTTRRYGRQLPLSEESKRIMGCQDIDNEIERVRKYKEEVDKDAPDPEALMMDFGIGNVVEKKAAFDAADRRIAQLEDLKKEKNCPAPK